MTRAGQQVAVRVPVAVSKGSGRLGGGAVPGDYERLQGGSSVKWSVVQKRLPARVEGNDGRQGRSWTYSTVSGCGLGAWGRTV